MSTETEKEPNYVQGELMLREERNPRSAKKDLESGTVTGQTEAYYKDLIEGLEPTSSLPPQEF